MLALDVALWNSPEELLERQNERPFQFVPRFYFLARRTRNNVNCESFNAS